MKKQIMLAMLLGCLIIVTSYPFQAQAQIDNFTYFIPYPSDRLDDQFNVGHAPLNLIDNDIETTISIAVHRSIGLIYYDHWEDGLEPDLTHPVQASTRIWGDDNPANGMPPGFTTDVLTAGDVLVLRNVVSLPRNPDNLFFDGGDKLISSGGAVAVTMAVWPHITPTPPTIGILYAGAWELYPTNRWGLTYQVPVGDDLATRRLSFRVVGVNIQAAQNNTIVQLDLDANGDFEIDISLDQGESFSQIDGVKVGAHIRASRPVQVHVLTANPDATYEARAYTIIPFEQWTDDLLGPRSSDGDYWLYNPHSAPLPITAQTMTNTTIITAPPESTIKYPPTGLSSATGVRFRSTTGQPFYAIAALDANDRQDWGYTLQPFNRLTTQTLVGWGPGNNNVPPDNDESRIYVTAVETTTVFADYNNDGAVDAEFPVSPLSETAVVDPDHDLTGAALFTRDGTPFLAVWGQDETADPQLPSIDVGTSILPLPSLVLQKSTTSLREDVDCTGTTTVRDTIQYKLAYLNNTANPLTDVTIQDNLPPELTYLPNSTILDGNPLPDQGTTPFPLDEGGYNLGLLDRLAGGFLTFEAVINRSTALIVNRATIKSIDRALETDFAIQSTRITTTTDPVYRIDLSLSEPLRGGAAIGQALTFTLSLTNTDTVTFTQFSVEDTFNQNHLTFQQASIRPDSVEPGVIRWDDLTRAVGALPPGETIKLDITFLANSMTPAGTDSLTTSRGMGRGSDGFDLPVCRDQARVVIFAPTPTLTPTSLPSPTPTSSAVPSPTPDDDDDGDPVTPGPPSPPSTAPPPTSLPPQTSATPQPDSTVLPVSLLPETGRSSSPGRLPGPVVILSILLLLLLGVGGRRLIDRGRRNNL